MGWVGEEGHVLPVGGEEEEGAEEHPPDAGEHPHGSMLPRCEPGDPASLAAALSVQSSVATAAD
jgi:hypothetical protein